MTSNHNRYPDELPPSITTDGGAAIRTAAGSPAAGHAYVTNRAPEPRILAVSFLGVDADWLPDQTRSRVLMPGETVPMDFTLHPAVGTLSARYPFAITVQAIDPASGQATSSAAIADCALVVDAPGRVEVQVVPNEITRRLRGTVSIKVTNVGNTPENVRIDINAPDNVDIALAREQLEVQPGASATVAAKVAVAPQAFGRPTRYSYTVTARGRGAARRADAAITTRSIFGNTGPKFFAIVAIIALWTGLAITLIPTVVQKINQSGNSAQDSVAQAQNNALDKLRKTQTATPSAGASGAGGSKSGGSGSGGSGSGGSGSGGSGAGGSGSGGSGAGGSGAGASATGAQPVQFSGTVAGDSPAGVVVSMRPTSLVDEAAQSATGVGVNTASFTALGKIPAEALTSSVTAAPAARATTSSNRSTTTKTDGAWGFAKVTSPGYYLVTFAKPGFQTQRYVLDASSAAAADPLKVTLLPGKGRLGGRITGPDGAVGGATITLSDGTNTLASSSNSKGDTGAWSVDGLSTPGTYLVTASKDGLSTESTIVTLGAGGAQTANLSLKLNSATLTGNVYGPTTQSDSAPLGGVSVTARSESTERTSTTITSGNLTGTFRLPDLPAGHYVITTQAPGYLTQTRAVTITEGQRTTSLRTDLRSATAVVTGVVRGIQFDTNGKPTSTIGPVNGAGITLTSATDKYKVTTDGNGAFRLDGVAPGSYVLSAEFAGLGTAYSNIDVQAGVPVRVPIDALQLPAANNRDSSSITGFVAGATNPTGAIICPSDAQGAPTDCDILFTLRNSADEIVKTNIDNTPPYVSTPMTKPINTGPTPYSLFAENGLPAGVYQLTVSAEGYLATTVAVRVPANTVATAPTASLFPTNGLVGSVTSTGKLATDGPAPLPTDGFDSCVWAVPAPQTAADAVKPLPSNCPTTPADQTLCKTTGRAQASFVLIDHDTQVYKLNGLCNGTYRVYAASNNPWYVSPSDVVQQTLFQGQTVSYSPHLVRDGKVELTVKTLDSTGQPTPAKNLTGSATCKPSSTTNDTSQGTLSTADANGVVVVDGVDAGNVTCTVSADGGYSPKTISNISVSNENTSTATVVLTKPIGDLAGRLITSYRDKTDLPVKQTQLTINGIVDDGASTKSVTFTVTTDGNGCFAITREASGAVATGAGPCATIAATSVVHAQALVSASVEITSSGGNGLQGLFGTYTLSKTATDIRVTPIPVSTTDVKLSVTPAGLDVSGAAVTVTPIAGQANGAGTVSIIKVGNDGTLTWQDSIISSTNLAAPGKYTIKATLAGFKDTQTTVDCPLAHDTLPQLKCTLDGSFVLVAKGGIKGTVSGIVATGPSTTYVRGGATRSYPVEQGPAGLTVTARACAAGQTAPNCGGDAISGNVRADGSYDFNAGGTASTLDAGDYQVTFAATGYASVTRTVTVTGGASATSNANIFLSPVKVTVQLQRNGTSDNYTCSNRTCTVLATRTDTAETVTLTRTAGTGLFTADTLAPATYRFDATGDDFSPTNFTQIVARNDNPPTTATANYTLPVPVVNTSISGSVTGIQGTGTTATPLDGVTVELGSKNAAGDFVPGMNEDGKPLSTTTLTRSGARGEWIINAVPSDQGYFIRFNGKNTTGRLDGYRETVSTTLYNVARGQDNRYGTATVDRVTRKVVVGITTSDAASDIGTSALRLTSVGNGQDLSMPQLQKTGQLYSFTFNTVPFGSDYKLKVQLPAGHLGQLTVNGVNVATCTADMSAPSPRRTCTVDSSIVVSGADDTTDTTVDYALNEYLVSFKVVAVPLAGDTSATRPSTVNLKINDADSPPAVYADPGYPVDAAVTTSFWGRSGRSYTSSVADTTQDGKPWTAAPVTFAAGAGTANQNITLAEQGSTVTVTVTNLPGSATSPKVALMPANGAVPKDLGSNNKVTFTDVPYGTGYVARLTSTKPDGTPMPDKTSPSFDVKGTATSATIDAG